MTFAMNEYLFLYIFCLCSVGQGGRIKQINQYENGYVVMEIFVFISLPFFSQIPGSLFATIKANQQQKSTIEFATANRFDAINQRKKD